VNSEILTFLVPELICSELVEPIEGLKMSQKVILRQAQEITFGFKHSFRIQAINK